MKFAAVFLIGILAGFPGGVLVGYNSGYYDAGPFSVKANEAMRDCLGEVDRLKSELAKSTSHQGSPR